MNFPKKLAITLLISVGTLLAAGNISLVLTGQPLQPIGVYAVACLLTSAAGLMVYRALDYHFPTPVTYTTIEETLAQAKGSLTSKRLLAGTIMYDISETIKVETEEDLAVVLAAEVTSINNTTYMLAWVEKMASFWLVDLRFIEE